MLQRLFNLEHLMLQLVLAQVLLIKMLELLVKPTLRNFYSLNNSKRLKRDDLSLLLRNRLRDWLIRTSNR